MTEFPSAIGQGSSILIVDDAPENLRVLSNVLRHGGLVPRPIASGKLAMDAALSDPPDLVLLDVNMPDISGLELCRLFKKDERLRDIPIIFISGLQGIDDKVAAFRAGGVDYVTKPFHEEEVLARVKTQLRVGQLQAELVYYNAMLEERVQKQVKAITATQMSIIFALAKLAETRDDDTGHHIERVQTFSRMLAEQMRSHKSSDPRLTPLFIGHLEQTASLHDIGKVGTPDAVLLKPGKLTPEEFVEMQKHCTLGSDTLATVLKRHPENQFLRMGVRVARSHHEKWDGSGYPDGLQRESIPLEARIVGLADFYDALTSNRCYRPAFSHEVTCKMIDEGDGQHFDPVVVAAFREVGEQFWRVRCDMQS